MVQDSILGEASPFCWTKFLTPDFPQSEIKATIFCDSGGSLGEELGKMFCAFPCFICFTEWRTNLLPKFLPIYHSMSCGWNVKISSPRASGVWGPQSFQKTKRSFRNFLRICPDISSAFLEGRKVFLPDFTRFFPSDMSSFKIRCHPKTSKRSFAGMAVLTLSWRFRGCKTYRNITRAFALAKMGILQATWASKGFCADSQVPRVLSGKLGCSGECPWGCFSW